MTTSETEQAVVARELVAFVNARLDEREALARAADGGPWRMRDHESDPWVIVDEAGEFVVHDDGAPSDAQAQHIAANDPAHVLREVAAMRAIVARYQRFVSGEWYSTEAEITLAIVIRHLAAIWSEHADYRAAWKP